MLAGNPISAIAQTTLPEAIVQQPVQEIRGVWITNNDTNILRDRSKLQEAVSQLARLNFNTIYPVVWNSGYVMYESAVAQQAGIQPFVYKGSQGQDIIAEIVAQGHRQGLLVIPWFEFGFMTPSTSELALNHPEWITQKRDGNQTWTGAAGEVVWLNPFHPEVQQFITDLVVEIVTKYDVDGIQFDDHTSLPNVFGYDRYTIALYQQETGNNPPANPQDPAWVRWRADKITAFVAHLNKVVKERKPNAIFSVSPNPYVTAYNGYLQDWLTWVRQGIVDELIVQVYRPDLQSFLAQLVRPEIQEVQQKIPTAVGVLTGLRNNPVPIKLIQDKVRVARDRGL
ncbi:MAG TPA: glycoside hydrolase family 10 protein, partial [Coleofasciculaceae cyanobacterium]